MSDEAREEKPPVTFDAFIKAGLERFYPDLACWLFGRRPVEVEAVETGLAAVTRRVADKR